MKLIHVDAILIFLRMGNHRLKVIWIKNKYEHLLIWLFKKYNCAHIVER
jgi:hypothetical protein